MKDKSIDKLNTNILVSVLINILLLTFCISLSQCINTTQTDQKENKEPAKCHSTSLKTSIMSTIDGEFIAHKTTSPVLIDGCSKDSIWVKTNWYDMNYKWIGEAADSIDYFGKFKLAWDSQYLYILVEVN